MNKIFLAIIAVTYATQSLKSTDFDYEKDEEADERGEAGKESELTEETAPIQESSFDLTKMNELKTTQEHFDDRLKKLEESIQDQPKTIRSFAKKLTAVLALILGYHLYFRNSLSRQQASLGKSEKMTNENNAKEFDYEKQIEELGIQIEKLKQSISLQDSVKQEKLAEILEEIEENSNLLKESHNQGSGLKVRQDLLQEEISRLRHEVGEASHNSKLNSKITEEQAKKIEMLELQLKALKKQRQNSAASPQASNASPCPQSSDTSPKASNTISTPQAKESPIAESPQADNTSRWFSFNAPQPHRSPEQTPSVYSSPRSTGSTYNSTTSYSY